MRIIFLLIFLFNSILYSQNNSKVADFEIVDNDTVFLAKVPEVEIVSFRNSTDRKQYFILKRKVLKVYPYALLARDKLRLIQENLDAIPRKRHKKRYIKDIVKQVKKEYSDVLKKLTMSEGRILVKLIYRETQITSYEIVKTYRGRFNAFFWQTMAKVWNNNLKTDYDPINVQEDMFIEHIILQAKLEGKIN